ncbi:MAG TPA: SDR family NAD(P)-dependent oxidoreductase, partial [Acidimicrobiales bacterium]|nr:SDR family NAD(P)-dependent oxidoreductase [Acidimicrobiales bacterium]
MSGPPRWHRALVTGASSGIGTAIARRLAADGTHVVLVARDLPRLDRLAIELRQRHGVEVEVLVTDLADDAAPAAACRRVAAEAAPDDVLVANACFGTGGVFHELPLEGEEAEIRVNLLAPVRVTHAALGAMVPRGAGGVVLVSSLAGLVPAPRSATYA